MLKIKQQLVDGEACLDDFHLLVLGVTDKKIFFTLCLQDWCHYIKVLSGRI